MKTCYYKDVRYFDEFTTLGWSSSPAAESCLLAVHYGRNVGIDELQSLRENGTINGSEYDSIRRFDVKDGNKSDLNTLRKLAKRLGIRLLKKNISK